MAVCQAAAPVSAVGLDVERLLAVMAIAEMRSTPASRPSRRVDGRLVGVAAVVLLIAVLVRPMVFGRTFVGWDWYSHEWYIWHQAGSLKANLLPSFFAHNPNALFNPHFAFYGGTLYTLAGALTVLTGDPNAAMVIVFSLGIAAAYGGWYWLGRQAGLTARVAHIPAVLFVTAPYYLAMIYASGAFAEFTAVSMVPLMLASAFAVLRADRLQAAAGALLAVSVTIFTGSHNLTLLWGATLLVLIVGVLFAAVPGLRRTVTRRGLLRVAGVAVPAVMVNAWFLLPDIAYQSQTFIANHTAIAEGDLKRTLILVRPSHLFSLGRGTAWNEVPHHALQLPVLALAWCLVALAIARAAWRSSWFRAVAILLIAITTLVGMMESFSLLWGLPRPYNNLQFSYRLESYILLAFSGAVIGALVLVGRRRALLWSLAAVACFSIGGAVWQIRQEAPSKDPRWTHARPYHPKEFVLGSMDYIDHGLPVFNPDPQLATAKFPDAERGDKAEVVVNAAPGDYVRTNIVTLPKLVTLEGGRFVGREPTGQAFVQLGSDAVPGAAKLTIRAARPWPVVGGWVLTLLGLAGLAANAVVVGRRSRARRRTRG
jgi:hypothetical protein